MSMFFTTKSLPTDSEAGYGSIPSTSEPRSIEAAEAEEGPFPVNVKSMLVAEFFGTATYVQLGCAANCVAAYANGLTQLGIATAWGIAYTIAIYLAAPLSGGHLNPALSLSFALVRPADLRFRRLWLYWMAQLLGAITAGALNLFLFHRTIQKYEKKHLLTRGTPEGVESAVAFGDYYSFNSKYVKNGVHAFFIEAFGTAVLGFVLFVLTNSRNPVPGTVIPVVVGMTYGVLVLVLGQLTGASLNPARDLGPRLVTLMARWGWIVFTDFLPYLFGPMVGAPVGAFLADKVLMI